MPNRIPEPEKYCVYCGKRLHRKYYGKLEESPSQFLKRKYCDKICYASHILEIAKTVYPYERMARKKRGKICVKCHGTKKLHIHHIDKDKTNNKLTNLMTLCASCHVKEHRQYPDYKQPAQTGRQYCPVCGLQADDRKTGYCKKHYYRFKHYGDPLILKVKISDRGLTEKQEEILASIRCVYDLYGSHYGMVDLVKKKMGISTQTFNNIIPCLIRRGLVKRLSMGVYEPCNI